MVRKFRVVQYGSYKPYKVQHAAVTDGKTPTAWDVIFQSDDQGTAIKWFEDKVNSFRAVEVDPIIIREEEI